MKPKKLNLKDEARRAQSWNDMYPTGTPVTITLDDGRSVATKTDSAAWLLAHGQAVICVAGKRGGWALERVHAIRQEDGSMEGGVA